jgi:hypothetical protein
MRGVGLEDTPSHPALWRGGLRPGAGTPSDDSMDEPARVLRVDPRDGAMGVFRDSPVIVRLSGPVDPFSISADTFHVEGPRGAVAGRVGLSPDALCLIWSGDERFATDALHFVVVRGLVDQRGRPVAPHVSRFVSCDLIWSAFPT